MRRHHTKCVVHTATACYRHKQQLCCGCVLSSGAKGALQQKRSRMHVSCSPTLAAANHLCCQSASLMWQRDSISDANIAPR